MNLLYLKDLSEDDKLALKKIPALVTILVGGADDNLDEKEIKMGKISSEFRKEHGEVLVHDYFEWVSKDYVSIFETEWNHYKSLAVEERTEKISGVLTSVNDILQKIDKKYAHALVTSWRGLARAVANTSGGILGKLTMSNEEKFLIGLDMLRF